MSSDVRDVRYVCLSDLHLGEADSILTPLKPTSHEVDPFVAGPVLEQLVLCLEHVLRGNRSEERPILILNGDALELAFGTFNQALTNFERLAGLLLEKELFEKIVYIPGNHDHHIWEIARETQYANVIVERDHERGLPSLRHVSSPRIDAAVPAYLLNKIIEQIHPPHGPNNSEHEVLVTYPNLALLDESGKRCVLIHHGHYVEPLYHFFSSLRRWLFPDRPPARSIDEIEAENFAWIEFVWSLLGRSGGAGADMRALFRILRNAEEFDAFADALARRTVKFADVPWIPGDVLERLALKKFLTWIGPKLSGERSRRRVVHSSEVRRGIEQYLFGPAYQQLEDEIGYIPDDISFIFGHTHKPFEALFLDPSRRAQVEVYNTGGWPIDSREPFAAIGASILFMNERLDVASLRVYNDGEPRGDVSLELRRAAEDGRSDTFCAALQARLRDGGSGSGLAQPWLMLRDRIHDEILRRRRHHQEQPQ